MATVIRGRSTGSTTVEMVHESGAVVGTVAPRDNGGDGSRFSPTDLFAASLGACACTIMSMFAAGRGLPLERLDFEVVKEMSPPPRRVARLSLVFKLGGPLSDGDFAKIVAAGKTCPVRLTLGEVVEIDERYERA